MRNRFEVPNIFGCLIELQTHAYRISATNNFSFLKRHLLVQVTILFAQIRGLLAIL